MSEGRAASLCCDHKIDTMSTCAAQNLEGMAEVIQEHEWNGIWVHVDAAYAESALICEEYQDLMRHFEIFDSFDLSVSKQLSINLNVK